MDRVHVRAPNGEGGTEGQREVTMGGKVWEGDELETHEQVDMAKVEAAKLPACPELSRRTGAMLSQKKQKKQKKQANGTDLQREPRLCFTSKARQPVVVHITVLWGRRG